MKRILLIISAIICTLCCASCQKEYDFGNIDMKTVSVSPLSMKLITGQSKEIIVTAKTNSGVPTDISSECVFSLMEIDGTQNVIKLKGNKVTGLLPGVAKVKIEYKNLPIGYPTIIVE